ncbi:MAG TPA: type II secretion system protein [Acidimicrobiales bacterium]|nr:type II secretion system protein [Acidimicrobiales bacterium]
MARCVARHGDEGGFTLVETVVALAVLAIMTPALFGALFSEVTSARNQRQSAIENAVMVSVAESVKSDPYDPSCPTTTPIPLEFAATVPTNWPGNVSEVCLYVSAPTKAPYSPHVVEVVTLTAVVPGSPDISMVVVKRNPV